jgi:ATP-dependent helicase HrpA
MSREIRFDPALPVSARREEIRAALERHPVVVVCGETGSGKTTQLPKILLEMGRAPAHRPHPAAAHRRALGRGAHRRGARQPSSARGRLQGALPRPVGSRTAIKLMTDGILLAETQGDRELRAVRHASSSTRRTSAA